MTYRVQPVGLRNPGENILFFWQSAEASDLIYVACRKTRPKNMLTQEYYVMNLRTRKVTARGNIGLRFLEAANRWMVSKWGQDWLTMIA